MKNETLIRKCKQKGFKVEELPDGRILLDGSIYIRNLHLPITLTPCKKSHVTIINNTAILETEDALQILKDSRPFTP